VSERKGSKVKQKIKDFKKSERLPPAQFFPPLMQIGLCRAIKITYFQPMLVRRHLSAKLLLLLLTLLQGRALAQKEASNWYFGQNAGMSFNTSPPSVLTNGALYTTEGCATISDTAGNLLFYTDGVRVYDRSHGIMANGNGLYGDPSSSQSGIIVPWPGRPGIYYVFTAGAGPMAGLGVCTGCFCYSIVDMSLNGGMGQVTSKNVLLRDSVEEKLSATYHSNGRDIWVVVHDLTISMFYSYLITSAGIKTTPVASPGGLPHSGYDFIGSIKFSPRGDEIAVTSFSIGLETGRFDKSSGQISGISMLYPDAKLPYAYGIEFSPDASRLYLSGDSGKLYQLNLRAGSIADITSSAVQLLGPSGNFFSGGQLQLGPDGKIYYSLYSQSFLGVVNTPDSLGTACNFVKNGFSLGPKRAFFGLPTFFQSFFADSADFFYESTCYGDSTRFAFADTSVAGVTWDFGDPGSGAANTSAQFSPVHVFTQPGSYTVTLRVTFKNGSQDEIRRRVTILPPPNVVITPSELFVCPGDSVTLAASNIVTFSWTVSGMQGAISTDSLISATPSVTTTYKVSGTDASGCKGSAQKTITMKPLPQARIFTASDTICEGSSAVLSALGNSGTYTWYEAGSPGTTSSGTNFLVRPSATGTYVLSVLGANGCINRDTQEVHLRPLPQVSATASPDSLCPGEASTLRVTGALSYLWADSLDPATFLFTDSTLLLIPPVSTTFLVTGTDKHGCVQKDTLSLFVKNKPPQRRITGPPYVCPSLSGVLYRVTDTIPAFPVSASTFTWTVSRGMPSASQSLTADSLRVDFSSNPGTAEIIAIERNSSDCPGDTLRFPVEIKSIFTPPAPLGKDTLCSRDSNGQVYLTPFTTPGSVYNWFVTGGTILSGNGTNRVVVNWTASGPNAASIWFEERSVTATDNCYGFSDTLRVSVFPTPVTTPIAGKSSVCLGDKNREYSVGQNNSSLFTWTLSAGGTIRQGKGTNVINVDWDSAGTFTLQVLEKSSKGCDADTQYMQVTVHPLPVIDSIKGPSIVCASRSTGNTYWISGSHPGSTYTWSAVGGTLTSGQGTDTIRVDWNTDFGTGGQYYLTVIETSTDSCTSQQEELEVTLDGSFPYIEAVSTPENNERELEITWPLGYVNGALSRYNLYRMPSGSASWELLRDSMLENHYTDRDVETWHKSYRYRYTRRDACGDSSASAPHSSVLLKAEKKSDNRVQLSWNPYQNWRYGLKGYELWRKLDQEPRFSLYQQLDTITTLSLDNSRDGFEHCYRIRAVENTTGAVSWSNDTCITFEHPLHIPTAFSPNGDGTNDTWVIRNIEPYKASVLKIYNRWGQLVYSAGPYLNNWNGENLPDGTYYYILELHFGKENRQSSHTGNVTLIR
jgi:gliding motility-associated-like protein